MKRFSVFAFAATVLLGYACSSAAPAGTQHNVSLPGHGAITLTVSPNPIVAQKVSGSTYDFPFDVVVRETGGRPVSIRSVSADVYAPGGIKLGSDTWDASKINSMGFNTNVPANGELRYHFAPRRDVADDRIFGSIYANIRVDGTDDSGTSTSATTTVTVTR